MIKFLVVVGLFMVMFGFLGFALWFARWKQEGRACCSTGIEDLLQNEWDPCLSCPKKGTDECDHDHNDEKHCATNVSTKALEDQKNNKSVPSAID
ncbi:MAG: hypothetical protein H6629_16120 [Calditrichae bacterium]|nr:hypothetical protein [Calditrichia bacterium]